MKKTNKLSFIAGFALGAVIFGSATAFAATGILATPSTNKIIVNGNDAQIEAYVINGNNYFKLRDVARIADFWVSYEADQNLVIIDTNGRYVEQGNAAPMTISAAPQPIAPTPVETPFPYKVGDTPTKCNSKSDYTFAFPNSPLAKKFGYYLNICGVGGCNWYTEGRFLEVNGINIVDYAEEDGSNVIYTTSEYFEAAKRHTERLEIITDIADIRSKAAVFCYSKERGISHMLFCEYVERGSDGKPLNVYFTEANSMRDNTFHDGIDGVIGMMTFEDFVNFYCPIGYAVKK